MAGLRFNRIVILCTILFQFCVSYASADRQNICTIPIESCGPVPPVLPESFTMKWTKVDLTGNSFMWMEQYLDADRERAKVVLVTSGNEMNFIFDFRAQEVVTWVNFRPGGSAQDDNPLADMGCQVERISVSELDGVMRYRHIYGNSDQSRMYSSNDVLNYGGPHVFAFLKEGNITDEYRGMPVFSFSGCVYDKEDDRTMESIFRWIDVNSVVPASGIYKMPVKIENKGKYYDAGVYKDFNEVNDIVWFEDNDNTKIPASVFQIPERMQCSYHKRQDEKMPVFPNFFSSRMEVVKMSEDWQGKFEEVTYDWYEEIWYDLDQKLVRLDFVPSDFLGQDVKDVFKGPISAVYDFNTGVVHYTEKVFGKCLVKKISPKDFLVTKRSKNNDVPILTETDEMFGIDSPTITYKGHYTVRDIQTKAWAGFHKRMDADGKPIDVYREFFTTAGTWHADYDDEEYFDIPIRDTSIYQTMSDGQSGKTIYEANFFKFKPSQSHLSVYDISGCLSSYQRKFFYFALPGANREAISHHHEGFLDALRQAIAKASGVQTPIRVQELEALFVPSKSTYQVSFSLLDVPAETADISFPTKGVDLTTAASTLMSIFKAEGLRVTFKYKNEEVNIDAVKDSLKEMKAVSEVFVKMFSPSLKSSENNDFPNEVVPVQTSFLDPKIMFAPARVKKEPTGYSSGSLAGLAVAMLLIGAIVGLAGMVFYNKKKLQREDRITLS